MDHEIFYTMTKDNIHLDFLSQQAKDTVQWLWDMANTDKVVDPATFNGNSNWVGESFFKGLVAIGFAAFDAGLVDIEPGSALLALSRGARPCARAPVIQRGGTEACAPPSIFTT